MAKVFASNSIAVINDTAKDMIAKYRPDNLPIMAIRLLSCVGGRHKVIILSVLSSISGIALARVYWKYVRVPPHLRGLARVPFLFTVRCLYTKTPNIKRMNEEYQLAIEDALRRGLIKSKNEHLTMWTNWQNGKWDLVIANPTDIKEIISKPEIFEKTNIKALRLYGSEKFLGSNISFVQTNEWKVHRKVVNPAFRRGWATSLFSQPASQLIFHFDKMAASGEPVDMSKWMSCMALDALSSVVFGKSFDSINNPNSELLQVYGSLIVNFLDPLTNLFGGNIMKYSPRMKKFNSDVDHFNTFVFKWIDDKTRMIKERESVSDTQGDDSKDLLEMMVTAQLHNGDYTREDLRSDCAIFFLAGHDTTAGTMTFSMYLLGMNEDIQERARQEVIKIMGDADPSLSYEKFVFASNEEQSTMRYLTCVIKEVMRLFPPLPNLPTRELTKEYTMKSSGIRLPKYSFVQISLLLLQRSKKYWGEDAGEFKPERWLNLTPDGETIPIHAGAHSYTWAPFGGGQRVCIGNQFTIVEQRVVLSAMLLRYTWKVVGDDEALSGRPSVSPGILLHPKRIMIKLTPRK